MKYKKSIDKVDLEELKEADTEDDKDDEPKGLMARRT